MLPGISPRKKLKSPIIESTLNLKTSVTCTNVPEGLFDANTAKRHFNKFGRVQKIRLLPKRQMCIIEYDQPISAERALLNAGAFEGFMFDVTRSKARVRRKSKKEDDPDWVPDSDVEDELSAMAGAPTYRLTRQKSMDIEPEVRKAKTLTRVIKQSPIRKKVVPIREKQTVTPTTSAIESPVMVTMAQTSMSTFEAAAELYQLQSKVSMTPDEQWRILDTRDRILRAWGGAGSRIKVGGATIGTCPDMCPEKELLHRQAEHQVMTLETKLDSDGVLEPWRAVKQYSRSSADQEIPMCYELRPATVLMRTCAYLLHEVADTPRQVTLADWFHFMWDRLRGIRKDITQQALCCSESIRLVEMCARFHAHCAARLADLEHTQFDQKLNTDNLTKCLQTLKHMYSDVGSEQKPREAEFRGYVALLNLGDANFWWEIKQLPQAIQKSEPILFAIQIFNALDNNNYVRFFRLVKERATYLQACILLRYFNDVRARALARIVKAYAPRGGSRFPAQDLMNALSFESVENMKSFINHYGLRFAKTEESELSIILDRNQFFEDSDPYPIARAVKLIESKRYSTVGEVIAGGELPRVDYERHALYSSFNKDGKLKDSALTAEDQGYNTINDSNKDIRALKAEIRRLEQGNKTIDAGRVETKVNLFSKPDVKTFPLPINVPRPPKLFSFKPAIPVAPTEIILNSPEKVFSPDTKHAFSFSKPENTTKISNLFGVKPDDKIFKAPSGNTLFKTEQESKVNSNVFKPPAKEIISHNIFTSSDKEGAFKVQNPVKSLFGQNIVDNKKQEDTRNNLFGNVQNKNIFAKKDGETTSAQNVFGKSIFASNKDKNLFSKADSTVKVEKGGSIFSKPVSMKDEESVKQPANIFGTVTKLQDTSKFDTSNNTPQLSIFTPKEDTKLSPSSLFKSVSNQPNGSDAKSYSIFQSKNKAQSVADSIFNSVNNAKGVIYEFNQNEKEKLAELQRISEERMKEEERKMQEQFKKEEEKKREELRRQEELRRKEEERRKQEEFKRQEEKRKAEEIRKQEELRKKLEEERRAEMMRKAEEERKFKAAVDKESTELVEELINDIKDETVLVLLQEEVENLRNLNNFANSLVNHIVHELSDEICNSEMKAEKFRTDKVMRKWFQIWKEHYVRNCKRRNLLEDTPVWLPSNTLVEEASQLRRLVENTALVNMNAVHRGYVFVGELKQIPPPDPYNIIEIIRSPLLKRMKMINYPYDKCFFWKITLVSPGETNWLYRKINIQKWLLDAFSDKKNHEESESLIHVSKQSWNHLIDFGISFSLTNRDKIDCADAIEGSNGILFYFNENYEEMDLIDNIQSILKNKYPYQLVPVSIIMSKQQNQNYSKLESFLVHCVRNNQIKAYKIFIINNENLLESLNASTKSALKWMAKNYPQNPPIEIDYLKSICQRYLGNEIWCTFKSQRDLRINSVLKDLRKLVQIYNIAVDKLTEVITDEDLFNYTSFPLEFKQFLDSTSPYPKPYEFVPSSVKNVENTSAIRNAMKQLKLPNPIVRFNPVDVVHMQQQIRSYSNQIGWFEDPEQVVCKVVSKLPNEFTDLNASSVDFSKMFENYDIIDFLNVLVYEKINSLKHFDKRFAVYKKSVLDEYRNSDWLFEINLVREIKHKALEYEDDVDFCIQAKRRKIAMNSIDMLILEDKDSVMVEKNIKIADESIVKYNECTEAMKQLEMQLEEGKKKSIEFENLLKSALSDE